MAQTIEGIIMCDDCGKTFKTETWALRHVSKAGHVIGVMFVTWQLRENGRINYRDGYKIQMLRGGIPSIEGFGGRGDSKFIKPEDFARAMPDVK